MSDAPFGKLGDVVDATPRWAVAVSGGVDSLTLMAFIHARVGRARVRGFHATSAAVPPSSTRRVEDLARAHGWELVVLDAGETRDPEYLANPVDRCRVCKSHLYDALGDVVKAAGSAEQIASGNNVDDTEDYRPGLAASIARGVRHPYVEAGLRKVDVRALARALGLEDVAELPAQPCLSSRIETGLRIDDALLTMVNAVEDAARAIVGRHATVRCRVRKEGVVIELDDEALPRAAAVLAAVTPLIAGIAGDRAVKIAPYRMGSAFLRVL